MERLLLMQWDWKQPDWPHFAWDASRFVKAEQLFLTQAGVLLGSAKHLRDGESDRLRVELMSNGALTTSEIEGEMLDRRSIQSSIQQQLGLVTDRRRVPPGERGIAEMTVDSHRTFADPLTPEKLFAWHTMITEGRDDLNDIGQYRTHTEPMQVVFGWLDKPRLHFEAPPPSRVPSEMARFLDWFRSTAAGSKVLSPLTRAGIAHLYFVSIHPFEDGNGRLARAIAEKALAQGVGQPMLVSLSPTVLARRKSYYAALEAANKSNDVTEWLAWFCGIVLEAQQRTLVQVEFIVEKAKLFEELADVLNTRQQKALLRMFDAGSEGFLGGLSARN